MGLDGIDRWLPTNTETVPWARHMPQAPGRARVSKRMRKLSRESLFLLVVTFVSHIVAFVSRVVAFGSISFAVDFRWV